MLAVGVWAIFRKYFEKQENTRIFITNFECYGNSR